MPDFDTPDWNDSSADQITLDLYSMAAAFRNASRAPFVTMYMSQKIWDLIREKGVTDFPPGLAIRSNEHPHKLFRMADHAAPL